MRDGSKWRNLNGDLACFKLMITDEMMNKLDQENRSEVIPATQPVKEYARLGFKQVSGGTEEGFEKLWRDTFPSEASEALQPEHGTLTLVPTHTLAE